jgi:predicted ester cyclase
MDTHSSYSKGTRAFKALWDGENGDKLRAIFDDEFRFHNLDGRHDVTDLTGLRQRVAELRASHPGARLQVENMIGSGSHIAFDWTLSEAKAGDRRFQRKTSGPSIRNGSVMVRLSGDCVAELWELNGALEG